MINRETAKQFLEVNGYPYPDSNFENELIDTMVEYAQQQVKNNDLLHSVSGSLFGFEIDGRLIELKAKSEKHALMQLVKNYWELIDKSGNIELLGERK